MMQKSLQDIMNAQDPNWLKSVLESNDVAWLNQQHDNECLNDRKDIIMARIRNMNPLVLQ